MPGARRVAERRSRGHDPRVIRRRLLGKLLLALASTVLALLVVGELGIRLWNPPPVRMFEGTYKGGPGERMVKIDRRYEVHPEFGIFQVDDALGYRPVPGGAGYGPHGAKWNEYVLEKPAGKRRLLFLGDSVTDRHKLVDALAERLGDGFECWNAGIPGYATEQELLYYRDYLGDLAADHVILTFHLNDYETTPIVFAVGDSLVAVHSKVGSSYPNPWLLRNSYLYRFGWATASRLTSGSRAGQMEAAVAHDLASLRDLVHARGADFTVLVLPWLQEHGQWPEPKPRHHELTLRTLTELGIRHYSFLDTLARALAEGVEIHEMGTDPQHPSLAFARLMSADLLAQGFSP